MAIQYPTTRKEIIDRIKIDIQTELPQTEPFIRNSMLASIATGYGGAAYDLYKTEQQLEKQLFFDTATGAYAIRWGALKNIYPKSATKAIGYINITGISGNIVPIGSELGTQTQLLYTTNANVTIATQALNIISITRSGSTATVTTSVSHYYANGNTVTIAGSDQTEYNGVFIISVIAENQFTYIISGAPVTPATGTIISTNTFATVEVTASEFGNDGNQDAGASLTFTTPIAGVNSIAFVTQTTLAGGSDNESAIDYRDRYIYVYRNPISFFNVSNIQSVVLTVPNVTRVFVQEITPDVGQVTIYFMCDGNTQNGIPTPIDITNVENAMEAIKPAHVSMSDIFVLAPIADIIDFNFSALSPNTDTMLQAITNNLQQMFLEQVSVGVSISRSLYISAIQNSIDLTTGKSVQSFTLSTPIVDIPVASGHIAVLGAVTS